MNPYILYPFYLILLLETINSENPFLKIKNRLKEPPNYNFDPFNNKNTYKCDFPNGKNEYPFHCKESFLKKESLPLKNTKNKHR